MGTFWREPPNRRADSSKTSGVGKYRRCFSSENRDMILESISRYLRRRAVGKGKAAISRLPRKHIWAMWAEDSADNRRQNRRRRGPVSGSGSNIPRGIKTVERRKEFPRDVRASREIREIHPGSPRSPRASDWGGVRVSLPTDE